jgi:hydroxyethylthiazole kinase-like uncharacterized protein yjeF
LDCYKYAAPAALTTIPSPSKAVPKRPQSRRFAPADDYSTARSVWTAATRRRFPTARHVAPFQSADVSAHSKTFAPRPFFFRDILLLRRGKMCDVRPMLADAPKPTTPGEFKKFPPRRNIDGNKGDFGTLAIIAGSFGFHGAGVLTARAAQRAQPGRITLFTQEKIYTAVASQLQAVMVNVWQPKLKFPDSASAILIGPGLAAPEIAGKMKAFTQKLWRDSDLPLVVDASALDWLPTGAFSKNAIRIITPHPGEAARLLKTTAQKIQKNRVESLREISKRFGNCWVVLKGNQTLIGRNETAREDARPTIFVNPSGNPHLAQGGSGDVLAGFIAGLIAQPELQTDIEKTIRYAVWQHGATADKLQMSRANWTVEDLIEIIGDARR